MNIFHYFRKMQGTRFVCAVKGPERVLETLDLEPFVDRVAPRFRFSHAI